MGPVWCNSSITRRVLLQLLATVRLAFGYIFTLCILLQPCFSASTTLEAAASNVLHRYLLDQITNVSDFNYALQHLHEELHPYPARRLDSQAQQVLQFPSSFAALAAAPWLLPPSVKPPYANLQHNLTALLSMQGKDQRVSMVLYTAPMQELLLNWVFSLVNFGGVTGFIVVTIDQQSMDSCISLGMPCWDAQNLAGFDLEDPTKEIEITARLGSRFQKLMHIKAGLSLEVLKLGYDVHFSDVDVIFTRNVWKSFQPVFDQLGADASFMSERFVNHGGHSTVDNKVNCGHYVMRSNPRTVQLLAQWAADTPDKQQFYGEQAYFNSNLIKGKYWELCTSKESCSGVQSRSMAALYPYPEQMNAQWGTQCPNVGLGQPGRSGPPCSPWMVAFHYICIPGKSSKIEFMKLHKLWFVGDGVGSTPSLWAVGAKPHDFLPCPSSTADLLPQPKEDL